MASSDDSLETRHPWVHVVVDGSTHHIFVDLTAAQQFARTLLEDQLQNMSVDDEQVVVSAVSGNLQTERRTLTLDVSVSVEVVSVFVGGD